MPHLIILQGPDADRRIAIKTPRLVLGRSPRCDFVLNDREVSRQHLEICFQNGQIELRDLNSSNGTLVNGKKISQHQLTDQDHVQLGRNLMIFIAKAPQRLTERSEENASEQLQADIGVEIIEAALQDSVHENAAPENLRLDRSEASSNDAHQSDSSDQYWQMLYRAVIQITHTSDLDQLYEKILKLIFQFIDCDRACILLSNRVDKSLVPVARKDRRPRLQTSSIKISQTILSYVIDHNEGIISSNASEDDRWDGSVSIEQAGVSETICVPMPGRHGLVGVIYIDTTVSAGRAANQANGELFNGEHLKLLSAIGHHAALIVEDAYTYQAMLQSERLATIGTVTATISHHIKNILQGIEGGGFLVRDAITRSDLPAIQNGWGIVEKNQAKIKSLVLDMLAYSKQRQPNFESIDLNKIVGDVVELVSATATEQKIALEFLPELGELLVIVDAESIYHAVLNLVSNAIDACNEQRRQTTQIAYRAKVSISTQIDESTAQVCVRDNGIGLTADQISKLFIAFESSKGGRGNGLGLAVSKKIVVEHGGTLSLESSPGEGSAFKILLPFEHSDRRSSGEQTISL